MTQGEALAILKTGANVYLTGEPGSGKTYAVNEFVSWLRAAGIEPSITAATGIAATHVGGMTLHAWSGIGVSDRLSEADIDLIAAKENVARRVAKAKLLIIEEISMLSGAAFEAVDAVCRSVRRDSRPFGGLTLVLVGDFFQLPPVSRGGEARFVYESASWREANPLICYLSEQHRQDDGDYLEILSAIRRGEVDEMHHERLLSRRGTPLKAAGAPRLYSHNADVDRENARELAALPGKTETFFMSSQGREALIEGLKRGCLSPERLDLKLGAAVMFTKNSPQGRFVNGTIGRVESFDASGMPVVATREGALITADPMEWRVEEGGKVRASVTQVPLRLAYAMTVHKSQGMSMDEAIVDLSQAFEYGQGYVALSRVRRLAGLHLLGLNQRALEVHPQILEKDRSLRSASIAAQEAFAAMAAPELLTLQKNFVKAQGGAWPDENAKPRAGGAGARGMTGRLAETLQAVRDEKTLAEAAKARGLTPSTVVKHLEDLAAQGKLAPADYAHLLPPAAALAAIAAALKEKGGERLAPVYSKLHGKYSYETIRLARLALSE